MALSLVTFCCLSLSCVIILCYNVMAQCTSISVLMSLRIMRVFRKDGHRKEDINRGK